MASLHEQRLARASPTSANPAIRGTRGIYIHAFNNIQHTNVGVMAPTLKIARADTGQLRLIVCDLQLHVEFMVNAQAEALCKLHRKFTGETKGRTYPVASLSSGHLVPL